MKKLKIQDIDKTKVLDQVKLRTDSQPIIRFIFDLHHKEGWSTQECLALLVCHLSDTIQTLHGEYLKRMNLTPPKPIKKEDIDEATITVVTPGTGYVHQSKKDT